MKDNRLSIKAISKRAGVSEGIIYRGLRAGKIGRKENGRWVLVEADMPIIKQLKCHVRKGNWYHLSVFIPQEQADKIRALAYANNRPITSVVRDALNAITQST